MPAGVHRTVLLTHVTVSVGWVGAVLAYLAFAVAASRGQDPDLVRAAYLVMEPVQFYALIPLAGAALLTGLVLSLGTGWGLVRHYWVIFKLALTTIASVVLVLNTTGAVRALAEAAARPDPVATTGLSSQITHATIGLVMLLVVTALGVYKPRGMTRYGWRRDQQRRAAGRTVIRATTRPGTPEAGTHADEATTAVN